MDFIYNLLITMPLELWQRGLIEKTMAVILIVLILSLVVTIVLFVAYIINTICLSYEKGEAKVISKIFKPAHTEHYTQPIYIGTQLNLIPMTRHVPDTYTLVLCIWEMSGELDVTKELYDKIKEGQKLKVKYAKNRLENALSFKLD